MSRYVISWDENKKLVNLSGWKAEVTFLSQIALALFGLVMLFLLLGGAFSPKTVEAQVYGGPAKEAQEERLYEALGNSFGGVPESNKGAFELDNDNGTYKAEPNDFQKTYNGSGTVTNPSENPDGWTIDTSSVPTGTSAPQAACSAAPDSC